MTTVGLIGLGAMGSGMAASLRRAGHSVQVFDVRREVAEAFTNAGGTAHDSLASLGAACDVVVSVVVNAAQTESVLFGDGQTPGCAASMKPGSVFVMCSTVDPNWSVALEARAPQRSVEIARCWLGAGQQARAIGARLETGTVWINEMFAFLPNAPFGGHKQSGVGVEHGMAGLLEFTNSQTITSRKLAPAG